MSLKRIQNKKYISLLFWICWIAYFSTYLARLNFNAVIVDMVSEGFLNIAQAGLIGTCYFFAYGIGQFISGFLADKSRPQLVMTIGLFLSALINISMGSSRSVPVMVVLWGLNGLALSLTWCPILKLFAELLAEKDRVRVSVHFGTCSVAGAFGSYFMCSIIVYMANWRWVFYIAAVILLFSNILWWLGMNKILKHIEKHGVVEFEEERKTQTRANGFGKMILVSGILFAFPAVAIHGALKEGITTWIPTILTDTYAIKSYSSILLTTLLPIVNLSGVYLGAFADKKIFKNEMAASAMFFLIAMGAVLGLILLKDTSIILSLTFFIIITTSMYGINILTIGLIPLKFAAYGRAATMTGIFNSLAYLGCAVATYGIGIVTQAKGWDYTMYIWLVFAILGLLCCLSGIKLWKKFEF